MSYPPPPGLKAPSSTSSSNLPPKPPPSSGQSTAPNLSAPGVGNYNNNNGARQTTSHAPQQQQAFSRGFGGFTGFQPRSVAAQSAPTRNYSPVISAGPSLPPGFSSQAGGGYQGQQSQQAAQMQGYPPGNAAGAQQYDSSGGQATPSIRNPFPLPGQGGAAAGMGRGRGGGGGQHEPVDPDMEAQIAQWQSAYASNTYSNQSSAGNKYAEGSASSTGANMAPLGSRTAEISSTTPKPDSGVAAVVTGADGKQQTVVRSGGGQTWQDTSLLEWDPAHFRLFVGNLAGEVTDESLLKAFGRYGSVQKARVVRDKRTTKSKGYGFVSFADGDEYFQAARDMQGKYIGSHPVLLRKSTTEIKATVPKDGRKKGGHKGDNKKGGQGDHGMKGSGAYGVQKKAGKMKGGLKVLG